MTDIVDRIRRWWEDPHASSAQDLMDEAADEIARLRLTADEREAVEWCRDNITSMAHPSSAFAYIHAATLRNLLEKLK
jgi:hypothetical protein